MMNNYIWKGTSCQQQVKMENLYGMNILFIEKEKLFIGGRIVTNQRYFKL